MSDITVHNHESHPRIVILQSEDSVKVVQFDGPDAFRQAHEYATQASISMKCLAIVAIRERMVGDYNLHKKFNPTMR